MAGRADVISNSRHVQRALQAVGFVALLTLAVGAVLTASGVFAGGLGASSVKAAYAPILDDTPTPTSTPNPCDPVWSVVSSLGISGILRDVEVVSANDVWAVGSRDVTLIEHWDGTSWSVVPSPNVGTSQNWLNGVAAVSATDVWAVGNYCNSCGPYQTLIEHWDGTSWSVVPSPNVGTGDNRLLGVAAVSATDVWAVGYDCTPICATSQNSRTLIEHWDGTSWSVVPSPNVGIGNNQLNGVAVVSANDVWAVGCYSCNSSGAVRTLIEHWDGTSWSVVSSPNVGTDNNQLYGVAAVSATDVWAVGLYCSNCVGGPYQTLVEHWDGTSWSLISSPNVGTGYNQLYGVAAVSANDVWAVGFYCNSNCLSGGPRRALVEHWDGTSWSVVSSPNVGTNDNNLNGVAVVSANDVWAVGYYVGYQPLVEHYATLCGTPTNTPTLTRTPSSTLTRTFTPTPTDTPLCAPNCTATPTPVVRNLVGHVVWQLIPQGDPRSVLPITLTLKLGTLEVNYPPQNTDASGFFTVSVSSLPLGTYNWRVQGPDGPLGGNTKGAFLSNCGTVGLTGASQTSMENSQIFPGISGCTVAPGCIRGGDASNDNIVNSNDFNFMKTQFNTTGLRQADFNNDLIVSAADFNILKITFNQTGCSVVLTAGGAFAGGLAASSVKPAYAPILDDTPTPTSTPNPCDPVWSVVSSPNGGSGTNLLNDVAVVTANDVWAVGTYRTGYPDPFLTLIEHWDGTSWSVVPSPNVNANNKLFGVAAVSANDVWAVGCYDCFYESGATLIEHWDGTSWSVVPSPNVGSDNNLYGVAAVSATDVWAVGYYYNDSIPFYTLIEHWDGTSWSVVPSPNVGTSENILYGVAAVSANDVWAVGHYCNTCGIYRTLIEHWDGTSWSVVPSPNPDTGRNFLYGVAAVSATDVWAVGKYCDICGAYQTLVEHWDGTSWSVVPSPNVGTSDNYLYGVAAVSATDVWAVGYNGISTLIEHWDGTSWQVVSSPNVGTNRLTGVAVASANNMWAVGGNPPQNPPPIGGTLVEHYATLCGTPTNTPTITLTPTQTNTRTITPTRTFTLTRTNTPTRTRTITPTPTNTPLCAPNCTATPTNTSTRTRTITPAPTNTPLCAPDCTATPTPVVRNLVGHVVWMQIPQGDPRSVLPLTLTLKLGTLEVNYPPQNTDASGFFTVSVTTLPLGTYNWRVQGPDGVNGGNITAGFLANCGTVGLTGASQSSMENSQVFPGVSGCTTAPGCIRGGDASNDNIVSIVDFNVILHQFNTTGLRQADFNNDLIVSINDFNILKNTFNQTGCSAVLTAGGAFAGGLGASSVKPAYAPILDDTPTSTPTSTPNPCDPVWSVVSSPNGGTGANILKDVGVVSANDVWAVGYYYNGSGYHTLVEHWDGTSWSVVPSPNAGTGFSYLYGVAAVSANDVWAVGLGNGTLVEHWDGTSWSVVPSPNIGGLNAVAAVSTNDVWAVGGAILHWDGTSWSVVSSPNIGGLYAVAAVSTDDVWAVGSYGSPNRTLIEHWDGTSWSVVPSPNVGTDHNILYGVAAVAANDVWAVGYYDDSVQTLVEHWDGTSWSVVSSPNPGIYRNYLSDVEVVSATDVWAVGAYSSIGDRTLIEHWDGTSWSVVSSPNAGGNRRNYLNGVAVVSATEMWAVGYHDTTESPSQTLVEHYATLCGTPTVTPTNTPTVTRTFTRTFTPTITPTPTNTFTPTITPTPTDTPLCAPNCTATPTGTPTNTPTPCVCNLVGHVVWQQIPQGQGYPRSVLPITLTLKSGTLEVNYPQQDTDSSGFFTVSVSALPLGTYNWRVQGPDGPLGGNTTPGFLSNCGTVGLTGASQTSMENSQIFPGVVGCTSAPGCIKGGDANNDNIVSIIDFNTLKVQFNSPGPQADFNRDTIVSIVDYNVLKHTFSDAGCSAR